MDIIYWVEYLIMVLFGTLLMLLSVRECLATLNLSFKPSDVFRYIVRYLGLLMLVYCTYTVLIDTLLLR